MIDLLVAGGGPVGLATALRAHRAGLTTLVLEPRGHPIDKACGEGLMPAAVAHLAALGVEPEGEPFRGIRYRDRLRVVDAHFRGGPGRGVRRTALSAALFDAVARAGIEVRPVGVGAVEQTAAAVTAAGVTARYLAAADGLHSPIARALGLAAPASAPVIRRWGLRQHFSGPPWTDLVEVHWSADAEAYVTPVGPDEVGVAVLSARRSSLADHLSGFPALRERLGPPATGVRGAGPLRHRTVRRTAGRVLLVGDASGYVDALTGEGIAVGLAQADALVQAVVRDRAGEYEKGWRRATRRYRVLTGGLLFAAQHPPLRRLVVPAAHAVPPVYRRIVEALARG